MDSVANGGDSSTAERAAVLREEMIDTLRTIGSIRTERVAAAFRAVPREVFTPGVALEQVYNATESVITKRDQHGVPISSMSAPQVQAEMLEDAEIRPGDIVKEVGSGGSNAAMIAELVGPTGHVVTVDIDPEVIDNASRFLPQAGYPHVQAVLADAEHADPSVRYNRLIVTVGAWDIPPTWVEALAEGGGIVVPLRLRGLTRSLALERDRDHLVARSARVCGFVQIQGDGAHEERLLLLRGNEIGLRFDDDSGPRDFYALDGVLATARVGVWSGVRIARMESFDTLQLWLATVLDGFCLFAATRDQAPILVEEGHKWFTLAAVNDIGDSFAYLAARPVGEHGEVEFGAYAFGPNASEIAAEFVEQVHVWDRKHRTGPGPDIAIWPVDTPDERLPTGRAITKRHSRITISWPDPVNTPAR